MTEERTLSNDYDEDGNPIDPDDTGGEGKKSESPNIRQLREKAERVDAAEAKNKELERELAFSKAGLPDSPQVRYFQETYQGEPTPEAITAAALEAEFIPKAKEDVVTDDEKTGLEAVQSAAAGGDAITPPGFDEELQAAQTPEAAHAVMVKYNQPVQPMH